MRRFTACALALTATAISTRCASTSNSPSVETPVFRESVSNVGAPETSGIDVDLQIVQCQEFFQVVSFYVRAGARIRVAHDMLVISISNNYKIRRTTVSMLDDDVVFYTLFGDISSIVPEWSYVDAGSEVGTANRDGKITVFVSAPARTCSLSSRDRQIRGYGCGDVIEGGCTDDIGERDAGGSTGEDRIRIDPAGLDL